MLDDIPSDTAEAYALAQELDTPIGLQWLGSTAFNDTFALIVDPETLPTTLNSISDLATYINDNDAPLRLCADQDFVARGDGLLALQEQYGFAFSDENVVLVSADELYTSLAQGDCDVVAGFRTDGHIAANNLQLLDDDLRFFPAYNAAPLLRDEMATAYPALATALNTLAASLDDATMAALNARASIGNDGIVASGDEDNAISVAHGYLCQNALITSGCEGVVAAVADTEASNQTCEIVDINGGFEDDRVWRTPLTRSAGEYSNVQVHSGDWSMQLGARGRGILESYSIAQTLITVPQDVDSAGISFWYYPNSLDVAGGDLASLHIFNESLSFAREIFSYPVTGEQAWTHVAFDLTGFRGDTIMLHFLIINDGDGIPTTVFIDDVELQYCYDKPEG